MRGHSLLGILRAASNPFLERGDAYRQAFARIPFDLNLVVYTTEELETLVESGRPFIIDSLRDGIELGDAH